MCFGSGNENLNELVQSNNSKNIGVARNLNVEFNSLDEVLY